MRIAKPVIESDMQEAIQNKDAENIRANLDKYEPLDLLQASTIENANHILVEAARIVKCNSAKAQLKIAVDREKSISEITDKLKIFKEIVCRSTTSLLPSIKCNENASA